MINNGFATMVRDMKWHIYNINHEPLCWEDKALEFDTLESANKFFKDVEKVISEDGGILDNAIIVEDILYYDGGYINATNLSVVDDELVELGG